MSSITLNPQTGGAEQSLGVFGKLPAHGDFVERNLPKSFLGHWDEWLQRSIASSRDIAGEDWLDYYLTSPVWYFGLGHGTVEADPWVGAIVPSVDSVGRYFPFTIAIRLGPQDDVFACLARNMTVFEDLAGHVIDAMQQGQPVDVLWQLLQTRAQQTRLSSPFTTRFIDQFSANISQQPEGGLSEALVNMSYSHTRLNNASSSLWHCAATESMPATTFTVAGLPAPEFYWAMLSNDWRAHED